jgi:acyl carrier protein
MTTDELRAEIADILGVEASMLRDDVTRHEIPKWDSIAALMIVSFLDDRIEGSIEAEELETLTSFGAIAAFARERGLLAD